MSDAELLFLQGALMGLVIGILIGMKLRKRGSHD